MFKRVLIAASPTLYWSLVFIALTVGAFILEQIVDRLYRWFVKLQRSPRR